MNCRSLTSIVIPDSVTSIGSGAFQTCHNLRTINYTGTEEQWNAISRYLYNLPSGCEIVYNFVNM